VLVNDSRYYLSGGDPNEYKKLDLLGLQAKLIQLNPGTYQLTFRRGGSAPKTVSVTVGSDTMQNIDISFDRSKNVLNVNVNE
jgi:hypothetical protein